jgi:antitoxin VapB
MKTTAVKAKIFQHGGSQALRLPKNFRFAGREVLLKKTKSGLLVQALSEKRDRCQAFASLAGSYPDFPSAAPQPALQKREALG